MPFQQRSISNKQHNVSKLSLLYSIIFLFPVSQNINNSEKQVVHWASIWRHQSLTIIIEPHMRHKPIVHPFTAISFRIECKCKFYITIRIIRCYLCNHGSCHIKCFALISHSNYTYYTCSSEIHALRNILYSWIYSLYFARNLYQFIIRLFHSYLRNSYILWHIQCSQANSLHQIILMIPVSIPQFSWLICILRYNIRRFVHISEHIFYSILIRSYLFYLPPQISGIPRSPVKLPLCISLLIIMHIDEGP